MLWLIGLYQRTLSPDHGPLRKRFPYGYCKFFPSCSEYGRRAIKKYGLVKGGLKTMWRIIRCNPLNKGGIDYE
ncbi:MAG: membrane protein insertion efficiency factor YidD [Candidatus Magasanikbacteria bacterium]|nr:membrane protein insertion efficiency factor YidD [Candidatus Magasanikbacteria bacterium]